jgi:hypothetical protein
MTVLFSVLCLPGAHPQYRLGFSCRWRAALTPRPAVDMLQYRLGFSCRWRAALTPRPAVDMLQYRLGFSCRWRTKMWPRSRASIPSTAAAAAEVVVV